MTTSNTGMVDGIYPHLSESSIGRDDYTIATEESFFGSCGDTVSFNVFIVCAVAGGLFFIGFVTVSIILCNIVVRRRKRLGDVEQTDFPLEEKLESGDALPRMPLPRDQWATSNRRERPRPATLCLGKEVPIYALPDTSRDRLVRSDLPNAQAVTSFNHYTLSDLSSHPYMSMSLEGLDSEPVGYEQLPPRLFSTSITPHLVRQTVKRYEQLCLEDFSPLALRDVLRSLKPTNTFTTETRTDPDGEERLLRRKLEKKISSPLL